MLLYRPKQKISTTASEEVKFPASSIDGLAIVATSGSYNDLTDKPGIPDMSDIMQTTGTSTTAVMSQKAVTDELNTKANSADLAQKANLSGGNTFNGNQVITGYLDIRGTAAEKHLKTRGIGGSDGNGNSSDLYLQYSSNYKTYFGNTAQSSLNADGSISITSGTTTGNLTVGGNLTINGTTTTVDSTTLQVKDKLIEVAHGNTTTLTTPAGLVAPKYDGTNSGALVFDSTGTAYVGDVTLKNGNIDVANSGLQPLATRTGLVGGNLVQYDSSALTLKDSGKKISDLATTSQVNAKYAKPSGGIPKTDLESDVQTSLGKADSALQAKDISGKANLSGGNTFTGTQVLNSPSTGSGGYSINAGGYIKGSWLQASAISNKGANTGKICVVDSDGWIYYRTPAEILAEAGGAKAIDIPTNYVTTDTDQDIKGKKTVISPSNKDNSNQIATTAWAGRRYKSIADFGFTSQTTVKAIVQKIIDNWYEYCTFACTNDNFNNFSDTPDGYGTLIIEVGSNALRPLISFTKQIGDSNSYKHWQANIVRGANNQVTEIKWYEMALVSDIPDISGKLDKTKYEVNKTIDFGSSGVLYVGKFKVYDTNVTCEVTSTTNVTYSGKLVIATQNYVISEAKVYGDATNTVAPNFFIKPSTTSNPYIEVYFKPSSWSKNVVHIYGSNIQAAPTDVCTNVPSVPSTATLKPKNALTFELSGTTLTITL